MRAQAKRADAVEAELRATLAAARRALGQPRLRAIAMAIAITYAYFVGRPAWNQNSRFALTRALVETHSPIIDADHATTGDKSKRGEHFYSDKAPGLSALATVPYAVFYLVRRLGGGELPAVEVVPLDPIDLAAERAPPPDRMAPGDRLRYNRAWRIAAYLCRVVVVVPIAMLGLAALFLLAFALARAGPRPRRAASIASWVALSYGLATPAFAYATGFYGHRPAADLLLIAGALIFFAPAKANTSTWAGVALGLAVCIEYTAAPVVLLMVGWAWARAGSRAVLRMALTGAPFALALALYHQWAFGGPLKTGYDFVYLEHFAAGMRVRYGIHAPEPKAAFELLFGSYRGAFALAPVLILAAWGAVSLGLRGRGEPEQGLRGLCVVGLAVFTYYWLLNAGYYMWDGGASAGPRHMLPGIAWLCLGLVPAYERFAKATAVLAVYSALQALLTTYAGPEAPTWSHPIWGYAFFEFASFAPPASSAATNLGRFLGLPGPLSLIPLLLVWVSLVPKAPKKVSAVPPRSPIGVSAPTFDESTN